MGTPPLNATMLLTVRVLDADDLPPVFSHDTYSATVTEHAGERRPGTWGVSNNYGNLKSKIKY